MAEARPITTPLTGHFKLSSKRYSQSPKEEEEEMSRVTYATTVGLMYTMVCTRSDLIYVVSTVSRFLSNPEKQHWEAVK